MPESVVRDIIGHESELVSRNYTHVDDPGTILPFSAAMLRDQSAYGRRLETVSNAVNTRVQYHLERDGSALHSRPKIID